MTAQATDLIALPAKETALAVFSAEGGTDPYLEQIIAEVDAFVPDVSTRKGREAIASLAYKIVRSKTALDDVGKELVTQYKELPKKIDAERKRMREALDRLRDRVREPLEAWNAAEEARKAKHQDGIDKMKLRLECRDLDSQELRANIAWLEGVAIDQQWEEYEAEAARTKDKALAALREALVAREKYEAEQAELEQLRAQQAERDRLDREKRIAEEAADKARQEEADRAERERLAAEKRETELKLQNERAEREKLEAQQRADKAERDAKEQAERAAEAERQRIADEQAAQEAEARRREADREHKGNVLRAAKEAIMQSGITEDQAREVVKLIAAGKVPNVSIAY